MNERLSNGLYLGVADIFLSGESYSLTSAGRIVEKAVVMLRLPVDKLLSSMLARGRATEAQVWRVARRIADFHREAAPADRRFQRISALEKTLRENFRQTLPYL